MACFPQFCHHQLGQSGQFPRQKRSELHPRFIRRGNDAEEGHPVRNPAAKIRQGENLLDPYLVR